MILLARSLIGAHVTVMATRLTKIAAVAVSAVIFASLAQGICHAQNGPAERVYSYGEADVNRGLRELDAYSSAKLPVLEGFTSTDPAQFASLSHPYYQFKVEVIGRDPEHTLVRLEAKITVSFKDPASGHSEYRVLPSSGRLENDFFERLEQALQKIPAPNALDGNAVKQELSELRLQRKAVEEKISRLQSEIASAQNGREAAPIAPATANKIGMVKGQRVTVFSRSQAAASALLDAGPGDEFEVLGESQNWFKVKIGENKAGWVKRSQLDLIENGTVQEQMAPPAAADSKIVVSREEIKTFKGRWVPLKGKQAVFVQAQAHQPSTILSCDEKLAFARQLFTELFLQASHSHTRFYGVVVTFAEPPGGTIAATLENIRNWVNGDLKDDAFFKRCWLN